MQTKRRVLLIGGCLLVAALGSQPVLGQEQPQKPTGETQAAYNNYDRAYAGCMAGRGYQVS